MKDRIVQFLVSEKLSPAEFADKIGVQRSSMSHILNGRNHPSAAFLQKMFQVYPFLNPRWLMIGDGPMKINNMNSLSSTEIDPEELVQAIPSDIAESPLELEMKSVLSPQSSEIVDIKTNNEPDTYIHHAAPSAPGKVQIERQESESEVSIKGNSAANQLMSSMANLTVKGEIEQILFFFKDKTFTVYRPS